MQRTKFVSHIKYEIQAKAKIFLKNNLLGLLMEILMLKYIRVCGRDECLQYIWILLIKKEVLNL